MRVVLEPSPDGTSFAAFRANSAATGEIGLREGQDAAAFRFRATLYQAPRSMAFRAASAGHVTRRGPDQIGLGNDDIAIFILIEGVCDSVCRGRDIREEPGDIIIRDYAQPYSSIQGPYDAMVLTVPRDRLPAAVLTPDLHGARIPAAEGAARLLAGALAALLDAADSLSVAEFEAAVDGMCAMLASALRKRTPPASAETQRDRALALIERNLHERDFGPARLEAQLGLSRSSLYRLFEPLGGVSAVMLRRRLDRVLQGLLSDPASNAGLHHLAVETGFRDEGHLTRAFRKRFGLTPRAFQDLVARKDNTGLIAQAERAGFTTLSAWLADRAGSGA